MQGQHMSMRRVECKGHIRLKKDPKAATLNIFLPQNLACSKKRARGQE